MCPLLAEILNHTDTNKVVVVVVVESLVLAVFNVYL